MRFYWLVLGILCVWRITHLLAAEDGPWDLVVGLRRRAGAGFWANLLYCFYCLSLWISAPFAFFLGEVWKERIFLWLALSAGAILLNQIMSGTNNVPVSHYFEDEVKHESLLRSQEKPTGTSESDGR